MFFPESSYLSLSTLNLPVLKRSLLVILCISSTCIVQAQRYTIKKTSVTLDPQKAYFSNSLFIDDDGEQWIGGYGGAYRYNGSDFELQYTAAEVHGDTVKKILFSPTGDRWFETENGVAVKRGATWQYFTNRTGNFVEQYTLKKKVGADIWVYHYFSEDPLPYALIRYTPEGETTIPMDYELLHPYIYDFDQTDNGTYYAVGNGGVYSLAGDHWELDENILGYALAIDRENTIFLIDDSGTIRQRRKKDDAFSEVVDPVLKGIAHGSVIADDFGKVFFMGTASIAVHEDADSYLLTMPNGYTFPQLPQSDKNGNLWYLSRQYSDDFKTETIDFNQVGFIFPGEENLVHGLVFEDFNGDGLQQEDEPGVPNQSIAIAPGNVYAFTTSTGELLFHGSEGEMTMTWIQSDFWQAGSTPVHYTFQYPAAASQIFKIGIQRKTVYDAGITVSGLAVRPGFTTSYTVAVKNKGNQQITPEVTLHYDQTLSFVESSVAPQQHAGQTLTWTLPVLNAFEEKKINVSFQVPASTPLNTALFTLAQVTSLPSEEKTNDNIDSLHQVVTGSFDPNDKLVTEGILEEKYVVKGSFLTYTIRFQNTGTDTAFTVRVRDVIDPHLDLTSLEVLSSSHRLQYYFDDRALTFILKNILLPDSTRDEPHSHGYIKYRIKGLPDIADNTDVTNAADIYFDFNTPVATNTVSNRYVDVLPDQRVTAVEKENVLLNSLFYPNPTTGAIMIDEHYAGKFQRATLITTTGKVIEEHPIEKDRMQLTCEVPGLYLLNLSGPSATVMTKIMIIQSQ